MPSVSRAMEPFVTKTCLIDQNVTCQHGSAEDVPGNYSSLLGTLKKPSVTVIIPSEGNEMNKPRSTLRAASALALKTHLPPCLQIDAVTTPRQGERLWYMQGHVSEAQATVCT